jgi:aromatic ring-opening dioxygenase catalytic subunit (LigB family)
MGKYNEENIMQGIRDWKKCRNSKEMHPREEHLVPLFVILGAYEGEEKV